MLEYLTTHFLKNLGLRPPSQAQESARFIYHHGHDCHMFVSHDISMHGCSGQVVYINHVGEVVPSAILDESIRQRSDWLGLASCFNELYLLTFDGQLYNSNGMRYRDDVCCLTVSSGHWRVLNIKTRDGKYHSYINVGDVLADENRIGPIPHDTESFTCGHGAIRVGVCTEHGNVALQWTENGILPPRSWVRTVEASVEGSCPVLETTISGSKPYWSSVIGNPLAGCFLLSEKTLTEVTFKFVFQDLDIDEDGYTYLSGFREQVVDFRGGRIVSMYLFPDSYPRLCDSLQWTQRLCNYLVLLDSGRMYSSSSNTMIWLERPIIGLCTLDPTHFFALLDDYTVLKCVATEDGVQTST
jgi:hypothetical protein